MPHVITLTPSQLPSNPSIDKLNLAKNPYVNLRSTTIHPLDWQFNLASVNPLTTPSPSTYGQQMPLDTTWTHSSTPGQLLSPLTTPSPSTYGQQMPLDTTLTHSSTPGQLLSSYTTDKST